MQKPLSSFLESCAAGASITSAAASTRKIHELDSALDSKCSQECTEQNLDHESVSGSPAKQRISKSSAETGHGRSEREPHDPPASS